MTELSPELVTLLRSGAVCYLATTMPDGAPQLMQTWVDTDGTHVVVNTVLGYQKVRNVERDPRVALTVSDPRHPSRYHEVRGRVVAQSTEGGTEHIEMLAQRYTGAPYPWWGGRDQVRVLLRVAPDKINTMG